MLSAAALATLSILGWWEEGSPPVSRLFSLLAMIAAWWAFTMGLAGTDLGARFPLLLMFSQLFTGFLGAVLLMFTLAYLGRLPVVSARWALALLPGLAGPVNLLLLAWLVPGDVRSESLARFLAGVPAQELPLVAWAPWYLPLHLAHTLQLCGFTLASAFVFLQSAWRREPAWARSDAVILATIFLTTLLAIASTDVLGLWGHARLNRLGPLLATPLILLLYGFLRARIRTIGSLLAEREALLEYLPVRTVYELEGAGPHLAARTTTATVLFADLHASPPRESGWRRTS